MSAALGCRPFFVMRCAAEAITIFRFFLKSNSSLTRRSSSRNELVNESIKLIRA